MTRPVFVDSSRQTVRKSSIDRNMLLLKLDVCRTETLSCSRM
jgi:hypothetical protein